MTAYQPMITGTQHVVAAGHYLATQAAMDILEAGGNAIDAGVAANLVLGVVQSEMVQIAGVAPIMVYLADSEQVLTLTGIGPWPKATSLDRFVQEFGEVPIGILRTVVPAAPDANIQALGRWGTMSFGEVATAAIRYARDGFPMHEMMRAYIKAHQDVYRMWPQNAEIYLPDDAPPVVGKSFLQTDLSKSLQYMVDQETASNGAGREAGLNAARDAFYKGDIASAIVKYHRENEGLLSAEDLAEFACEIAAPEKITYKNGGDPMDIYSCGVWCQGPVLLQMIKLIEGFDLKSMGHNSPDYIHTLAEAFKLSFADREAYYGDPTHVDVPMEALLSDEYAAERRKLIRKDEAWPDLPPAGEFPGYTPSPSVRTLAVGSPPAPTDTSYVGVVDKHGNAFSSNPSDVTFESPVIPGTGLCPSARGSQSWAVRGHASALGPGKRPRLTPNPALAIRPGKSVMPFGTPGGDNQNQANVQVMLNMELFGMNPQEAAEAPRFMTHSQPNSFSPHEAYPGKLTMEGRIDEATGEELARRGHDVERLADMTWKTAGVCLVRKDLKTGIIDSGADPRRPSRAMGR
jgi:gamma-glutamyltranspeptidase/glutathione hydrolase